MACTGCEETVESALTKVEGVRRVEANHGGGTVEVVVDEAVNDDDLGAAVHDAGYEIVA